MLLKKELTVSQVIMEVIEYEFVASDPEVHVHANKENPRYMIKNDKTGKERPFSFAHIDRVTGVDEDIKQRGGQRRQQRGQQQQQQQRGEQHAGH
ncbi:hypothetical protein BZG36_04264 [Bifiguratus adelaidae]|uniref:Hypervirulence associated protein TUDOR domain-containing protein n=1 Tax=Bifiguratus adelaidae TaxID=1938954 RepID=A0A261XVZ8_9FUNG|nr:hypothetical protein BZG36_04264 [Bifiguratus adelaidae]